MTNENFSFEEWHAFLSEYAAHDGECTWCTRDEID